MRSLTAPHHNNSPLHHTHHLFIQLPSHFSPSHSAGDWRYAHTWCMYGGAIAGPPEESGDLQPWQVMLHKVNTRRDKRRHHHHHHHHHHSRRSSNNNEKKKKKKKKNHNNHDDDHHHHNDDDNNDNNDNDDNDDNTTTTTTTTATTAAATRRLHKPRTASQTHLQPPQTPADMPEPFTAHSRKMQHLFWH